jgi:hypothetical protein
MPYVVVSDAEAFIEFHIQEPDERGFGRAAGVEDPFCNQWWLNTPNSGK